MYFSTPITLDLFTPNPSRKNQTSRDGTYTKESHMQAFQQQRHVGFNFQCQQCWVSLGMLQQIHILYIDDVLLCFEFHIGSWGWLFVSVGFVTQQGKTDIIWPLPPTISCFGNGMSNKVTRRWDLESLELFMIPIETWSLLTCINSVNQGLFGHCFLSSNYIFRTAPTTHDDRKGKTKRIQEIQKELGPPNCEAIMNHYWIPNIPCLQSPVVSRLQHEFPVRKSFGTWQVPSTNLENPSTNLENPSTIPSLMTFSSPET